MSMTKEWLMEQPDYDLAEIEPELDHGRGWSNDGVTDDSAALRAAITAAKECAK